MIMLHGLGDSMEGWRWLPDAMSLHGSTFCSSMRRTNTTAVIRGLSIPTISCRRAAQSGIAVQSAG